VLIQRKVKYQCCHLPAAVSISHSFREPLLNTVQNLDSLIVGDLYKGLYIAKAIKQNKCYLGMFNMFKTKFTRKKRKQEYPWRMTIECKWTRLVVKQVRNESAIFRKAIKWFNATRD
jgi:hypothetical protein